MCGTKIIWYQFVDANRYHPHHFRLSETSKPGAIMGHLDLKEMCCFVSKHLDARDGEDQHLILSIKLREKPMFTRKRINENGLEKASRPSSRGILAAADKWVGKCVSACSCSMLCLRKLGRYPQECPGRAKGAPKHGSCHPNAEYWNRWDSKKNW